jgi:hypothetical protein
MKRARRGTVVTVPTQKLYLRFSAKQLAEKLLKIGLHYNAVSLFQHIVHKWQAVSLGFHFTVTGANNERRFCTMAENVQT